MTLAAQQAALMAALAGSAPPPAGFDATRVRSAAAVLAAKRARAVARAWPGVRTMLGDRFGARFARYAATVPLPAQGGPLADGRAFVRCLARDMALPDDVRLQVLAIDVRYRRTHAGLAPRRWPAARATWLPQARSAVVAIGTRRFWLVLPRLRR